MQIYKAFGLNIASEIACPEFVKDGGKADITIQLGKIPENYRENTDWAYFWRASPRHFYLSLKKVGCFLCEEGNIVTVEPDADHDPVQLRIFLLGSVFGALLHQRNIFPLHASAVERNGVAFAFTGDSGAGKSTLAAACLENDCQLLSDDLCAITKTFHDSFLVHPAYPVVKLSEEMREKINLTNVGMVLPYADSPKGRFLIRSFPATASRLRSIFVLSSDSDIDAPMRISPLSGVKKIQALLKNIYRYEYLRPMLKEEEVFKHCAFLAQHITVFSITGRYRQLHPGAVIRKLGILPPGS